MAHDSKISVRKDENSEWVDISNITTSYHIHANVGDPTQVDLNVLLLGKVGHSTAVTDGYLREIMAEEFIELHPRLAWLRRFIFRFGLRLRRVRRVLRAKPVEVTSLNDRYRKYVKT
jgi:hypothetical protein